MRRLLRERLLPLLAGAVLVRPLAAQLVLLALPELWAREVWLVCQMVPMAVVQLGERFQPWVRQLGAAGSAQRDELLAL